MSSKRRFVYPLLLLAAAGALWWLQEKGYLENSPQAPPRESVPPTWAPTLPTPRKGGPTAMEAPPPLPVEQDQGTGSGVNTARLLVPGTAVLDEKAWPWPGPGVPCLEAARKLARIRWSPPRIPFPGEEKVPDPDGIGPCPPRKLPAGREDTPVLRRYIDRRSFEPTWVHADGSMTSLNVAVREIPGKGKQRVVQILTKYR